jgi:hypothetical protein
VEKLITFSDGEVESVQWYTKEEIQNLILNKADIAPDSITVFNFYLAREK